MCQQQTSTPDNRQLLEMARKCPPPQSWWDDDTDPFVSAPDYGATPLMRARKCPLCDGVGSVPWFKTTCAWETPYIPPVVGGIVPTDAELSAGRRDCYGCNGQGYVWEPM